jgi:hypothetical protein
VVIYALVIYALTIIKGAQIFLVLRLRGGGAPVIQHIMGVAAGGNIKQSIRKDTYDSDGWDREMTLTVPVHILNSAAFRHVTGEEPPPTPISASDYSEAGLPFFDMDEENSDTAGEFGELKSVNEIEQERNLAGGPEPSVEPRLVSLDQDGHAVAHRVDLSDKVDDPQGLLDQSGPSREFRTLRDLEREMDALDLESLEREIEAALRFPDE